MKAYDGIVIKSHFTGDFFLMKGDSVVVNEDTFEEFSSTVDVIHVKTGLNVKRVPTNIIDGERYGVLV